MGSSDISSGYGSRVEIKQMNLCLTLKNVESKTTFFRVRQSPFILSAHEKTVICHKISVPYQPITQHYWEITHHYLEITHRYWEITCHYGTKEGLFVLWPSVNNHARGSDNEQATGSS